MTLDERATFALEIAEALQARLVWDIMTRTVDPAEQHALVAGTIGLLLRRAARDLPLPVDRDAWLEEVVRVALA